MGQLWNNVEAKGRKENGTWNKDPEGRTVGTVPLFSTTASWMATIYIYLMADHTGWEEGERVLEGEKEANLVGKRELEETRGGGGERCLQFSFPFSPGLFSSSSPPSPSSTFSAAKPRLQTLAVYVYIRRRVPCFPEEPEVPSTHKVSKWEEGWFR